MDNSWDSIVVPDGRLRNIDLNMERIRERGKQAADIIQSSRILNFDNLVTKNVQSLPGEENVQVNIFAV